MRNQIAMVVPLGILALATPSWAEDETAPAAPARSQIEPIPINPPVLPGRLDICPKPPAGQACVRPPANTCVRLAPHVVKDLGTALTRAAAIRVELERTKQQRLLKLSLDLLRQLRRLDLAFCALRRICGHTTSGRYDAEGKP